MSSTHHLNSTKLGLPLLCLSFCYRVLKDYQKLTRFGSSISRTERELFSLPTRLGGLGLSVLTECSEDQYISSKRITAPLVSIIILQSEKQHSGKELPDHQQTTEIIQEERGRNNKHFHKNK